MEQQTAVGWIEDNIQSDMTFMEIMGLIRQAKAMEKEQIKDAVIYGLDEDGHTGDWKISVAQNYYNEKHLEIKGLPGGDK
jgi:anionic cell wall polymer biosynthesis LytR-Cps2A-Psr (LCP) family protein